MDVVPVGVEPDGDMALPKTVAEAGWYQFGPRPGDASGATVLAAHVDTHAEGLGPFARLRSVKRGASVVLSTRDGAVHRYRVSSVQLVPKSEVPAAAVFDREGPPRLTLVTCGGAYDRGNGYSDNVVVTATSESGAKS
jgi:LPXTG-site transpeptidase (sortase) family protein